MIRKRFAAGLVLAAAATAPAFAGGGVYGPGPGGAIPDATTSHTAPGVFTSVINVPGNALNTVVALNSVSMTWGAPNHTWVGDIQVILTAPNGDNVHLFSRPGATTATSFGDSSDLGGTYVFVDADAAGGDFAAAAAAEGTGAAPVAPGTYKRSTNTLAGATVGVDTDDYDVFVGDASSGNWTLTVKDWGAGDTGTLASWSLDLDINVVPAPGALAMLGLAGLAGCSRRRRS